MKLRELAMLSQQADTENGDGHISEPNSPSNAEVPNPKDAIKKPAKRKKRIVAGSPPALRSKSRKTSANSSPNTNAAAESQASTVSGLFSGSELTDDEVDETKKINLFVRGTLGQGDNMAHVHPSTPLPKSKKPVDIVTQVSPATPAVAKGLGPKKAAKVKDTEMYQEFLEYKRWREAQDASKIQVPDEEMRAPSADVASDHETSSAKATTANPFIDDEAEEGSDDDGDANSDKGSAATEDSDSNTSEDDVLETHVADISQAEDKQASIETRPPHPDICEVTNADLQDALLKKYYLSLSKLYAVKLIAGMTPCGIEFSDWKNVEGADMGVLLSAMNFVREDVFVNLSRCDPDILGFSENQAGDRRYLNLDNDTAICLTPGAVLTSYLGNRLNSIDQKAINIVLHSQELERFTGAIGMALKTGELKVNIWQSTFSFTTFSLPKYPTVLPGKGKKSTAVVQASPTQKPRVGGTGRVVLALAPEDQVPVFDGTALPKLRLEKLMRKIVKMDKDMSITDKMKKAGVPVFKGFIRPSSFVVVAHTVAGNKIPDPPAEAKALYLNMYVQWVLVLAVGPKRP